MSPLLKIEILVFALLRGEREIVGSVLLTPFKIVRANPTAEKLAPFEDLFEEDEKLFVLLTSSKSKHESRPKLENLESRSNPEV